jgi:Uma2 family endonuclease
MAAQRVPFVTPEEYLARERQAETKSEYISGRIFTRQPLSRTHRRIITNVAYTLGPQMERRKSRCVLFAVDARVCIGDGEAFLCPTGIVCTENTIRVPAFLPDAAAVIEVVDASEESIGWDRKFAWYRHLLSLSHFVVIKSNVMLVQHYERLASGQWTVAGDYSAAADQVNLGPHGVLTLSDIYRHIAFEQQEGEQTAA